jgi:hypothetical protein
MVLGSMAARAVIAIFALHAFFATLAFAAGHPISVKAGESIQTAIDTANPGQLIFVEEGTYAEQLTVTTDGLQLVGQGAVLVPPSTFVNNTCSGLAGNDTEAGICVTGQGIQLADFESEHRKVLSVGQPIKDILVSGFQVRNFTGLSIAVVGGQDCEVIGNTLYDGSEYGVLTVGSNNTHIDANIVESTGDLLSFAVCMDDTSGVMITNNHVSTYAVGFCVQTNGAFLYNNYVENACWAIFVDTEIQGAQVLNNHVGSANPVCATIPDGAVTGITLLGASWTNVQGNAVEGQTAGGVADVIAAGIGVFDDPTTGAMASNNSVTGNVLRNNDIDILVYTNGTGNVVEGNLCTTPAELCG